MKRRLGIYRDMQGLGVLFWATSRELEDREKTETAMLLCKGLGIQS